MNKTFEHFINNKQSILKDLQNNVSIAKCSKKYGISRYTLSKYNKRIKLIEEKEYKWLKNKLKNNIVLEE